MEDQTLGESSNIYSRIRGDMIQRCKDRAKNMIESIVSSFTSMFFYNLYCKVSFYDRAFDSYVHVLKVRKMFVYTL